MHADIKLISDEEYDASDQASGFKELGDIICQKKNNLKYSRLDYLK